ncbi:hypothetical protein ABG79_00754 [Caloramator mitchellensis]|uniref:TIGR02679 family protein n=1 Tax=Caloramator mitchellensis TaxID=908809 RepID=A0A0R3JV60_CALMK|nr:TIGR02679 family protein [Caloramator mitchellensis]KRQ87416.1 hypothetical protein ABG79_00754 [Caloramator mitchellensis]
MDKTKECVNYFKSTKAYKRMFEAIREKYRSLGNLGGTIELKNLSPDEQEALSGLLKRDYYSKKSASVKIEKIINALENTKFAGIDFEKVLMGYFGEDLISKKEEKRISDEMREKFFGEILKKYEASKAYNWLESSLKNKDNSYKFIIQKYEKNKAELESMLQLTMNAINSLSFDVNNIERLAIFSSRISKNPHTFDTDSECGKLLLYAISFLLGIDFPKNAEERAEALYRAGIIDDEVSNFTMISGLLGYKNGQVHPGWEGFSKLKEPVQISLWNLSRVDSVSANNNIVYVFENPTVFSEVLYKTSEYNPSLICTYGQIRLASFVLLDKLCDSVEVIYYSGDFDPEGLLIADKLIERYGEKIKLWHFESSDYLKIISNKKIDDTRLKKLEKIKNPKLKQLGDLLKQNAFAAYQELLIDEYVADIIKYHGDSSFEI